jgi:hypothetical protein
MPEPTKPHASDQAVTDWMRRQQAEIFWFLSQPDLVRQHAGRVVVLFRREVLGSGRDDREALEAARLAAQSRAEEFPPIPELLFIPCPEAADFAPAPSLRPVVSHDSATAG